MYNLIAVASQSLKLQVGKMHDVIRTCTVFVMSCMLLYGVPVITWISWHCLMRQKRCYGVPVARKGKQNNASLWMSVIGSGRPYNVLSWLRMSRMDIVEFHPVKAGLFDTLNSSGMESLSILKHARWMLL